MPLKITIHNASSIRYRGKSNIIRSVERALKSNKVRHGKVDIILVGDAEIRRLHKQWFGENTVTDVITFPVEDKPPILAEIYIGMGRCKRQAKQFGVATSNELCRLAVHGALHIAGYTDDTEANRLHMHKLENHYIYS